MKLKDYLIIAVLAIIFIGVPSPSFVLDFWGIKGETTTDTVTVETVRYDTIPAPAPDTIYADTVFYPEVVYKEAPDRDGEDSTSVYADSVEIDSLTTIHYTANVSGRINSINFGITRKYLPQIQKTVTKTNTITETVHPKGIFAGVGVSSDKSIIFGIDYVNKNHIIGINISNNKDISVNYRYKIF